MNARECIEAQEIVSAASDGETIAAEEVMYAKKHCTSCAACAQWVSAVATLRKVLPPAPPEDAIASAMSVVRREAADAQETEPTPQPERSRRLRTLWKPNPTHAWLAAAASIVLLFGVGTIVGVRYLLEPPQVALDARTAETGVATLTEEALIPQDAPPLAETGAAAGQAETPEATPVAATRFVVFGDKVYEVAASPVRERPSGDPLGSLTTDLGSGTPVSVEVYEVRRDPAAILIVSADDEVFKATLVTRAFEGDTFVLSSLPLTSFGMWPDLPVRFARPEQEDGSPTFEEGGQDDFGAAIFVPDGATPAEGFAVAPGSAGPASLTGTPNWTWWIPAEKSR